MEILRRRIGCESDVLAGSVQKGIGRAAVGASFGTLASRLIGFIRTWVLVAAIGTGVSGDAYNLANNVPNMIFLLLGGGTIATVFVPRIIEEDRQARSRGNEYSTILVLGTAAFGVIATVVVYLLFILGVVTVISNSAPNGEASIRMMIEFAVWLTPQVFFYALISTLAQVANARGRFSAVAWTYAISSMTVIFSCVAIIALFPANSRADGLSHSAILVLGAGTLGGTVIQSAVVLVICRRLGLEFKYPGTLRGFRLRETAAVGLWTVLAAASYQVAALVVAFSAASAALAGKAADRGYASVSSATLIQAFAQAVLVGSVAAVLLQRISIAFADEDRRSAKHVYIDCVMKMLAILVPASALGVVAGPGFTSFAFSFGAGSLQGASFIGLLVGIFMAGFVAYGLHPLLLRAHYGQKQAMPPLMSAIRISGISIVLSILSVALLPAMYVSIGLVVSSVIAYFIDLPIKLRRLHKEGLGLTPALYGQCVRLVCTAAMCAGMAAAVSHADLWLNRFGVDFSLETSRWVSLGRGSVAFVVFLVCYQLATRKRDGSLGEVFQWFSK